MKNGKLKRFTHRALSMLLAVLTVLPSGLLTMPARAAEIQTTQTKLVVWDWITDMQSIGKGADYDPNTDPFVDGHAAIPVGDTKYTRIMFYQNQGGDRYYFNGDGETVKAGKENKVYLDEYSRIGHSAHKEWNQDLTDFEHFVTLGGERTPYIRWYEVKQGYQAWKLYMAKKDTDAFTWWALCQADDYEKLYTIKGDRTGEWGGKDTRIDPWIIDKHFVGAAAANYEYTHDNFVIWHWDNDWGQYNETMDFDLSGRRFKTFAAGTKAGVEEFKIYLGKEYSVGTLAENYTVPSDQSQTLGRPLYYIPKGKVLTVAKDAVLTIDGVLLNDGEIVVKDGGLLVVKDGAKIMPLTKYDNNCGMITSQGNIVVGDDALLCGGGVNGIRILGGGVVNFGVMAAESFYVSENYAIDNRETGWVLAGKSPSRESRIRYITDAIANEGATKPTDVNKDFAKIANFDSSYNIPVNGIYGNTANVSKSGEKAVGSADDPTLTVYVKSAPGDQKDEVLFKDVKLDKVSLRVDGNTATYTADGKTYTIQNKLVSATIGRGGNGSEVVFQNMWVGDLDGAWLQLEPDSNLGYRLALKNGSTNNGTSVIIWKANDDKDKWWHITEAGTVGVDTAYYIDNGKSTDVARGLDISGVNTVSNGASVSLYQHDDGNDQKWIIVPVGSSGNYNIRNAANRNVSLAVKGSEVCVQTNSTYAPVQRWNMANLLTEDAYVGSVAQASALELIPKSDMKKRVTVSVTDRLFGIANAGTVSLQTSASDGANQRWQLAPVGTDDLDGVPTVFYRITEAGCNLALEVQGDVVSGAAVSAQYVKSGSYGSGQYWYLMEAASSESFYVTARGNSAMVLTAGSSNLTISDNKKAENQIWEISGMTTAKDTAERTAYDAQSDPFAGKVFGLEPSNMSGWRLASRDNSGFDVEFSKTIAGTQKARWKLNWLGTDTLNGQERAYYAIAPENPEATGVVLGKYMVYNASENQQPIYQVDAKNGDKTQQWYVTENGDGTYTFTLRDVPTLTMGRQWSKNSGSYYAAMVNGHSEDTKYNYEYDPVTWNLIEVVQAPLDGKDGSNKRNTSVTLKTESSSLYQRWTFAAAGAAELDGVNMPYYTVKNVGSGMMLAITNGNAKRGANVIQWQMDDNQDKFWFVTTEADGYCTLVPYLNHNLRLDAESVGKTDGTNVQLYTKNGNDNQKWKLTDASTIDFIDGRVFYLSPKHTGSDMVLDLVGNGNSNGTKVQIYEKKETEIQRWKFEKVGTDYLSGKKCNYYTIKSVYATGKALDNSGSTANGARPHLWDYSATNTHQKWYVEDAGEGYYFIIPREDTTKYLGVQSANTGNNSVVELWDSNGDNRKWKLTETIAPETLGTYSLLPKHAPGMHVGPASSNSDNGTKLIIWEYNESSNYARWTFVKMGTDSGGAYYKIVNMANGKVIDATGKNTIQADIQLQQWDSDFENDQLWYLNDAGQDENGIQYYNIVNRSDTNYCMAVSGGSTTRGTGVTVSKKNGGDSQKFRLMERFEPVDLGTYEFGNPSAISMRLTVAGGSSSAGANIILYKKHTNNSNAGAKLQLFKIIQRGNDVIDGVKTPYYSIENLNGMTLDPPGTANVSNGTNVQQVIYDGYSDQHWYMEIRGDNTVVFRNRANSNLVLETTGTTDDSNVRLGTYSDSSLNQRWQLHPIMQTNAAGQYYIPGNKAAADAGIPFMSAEDTILNPEVGGKYNLTPQHATGLRMDLSGGNTGNGTTITAYNNFGNANQKWQLIPMGVDYFDGGGQIYYKLAFGGNANKVAQVTDHGPVTANLNVSIWDDEGCYDDQWYLEQAGERTDEDGEKFYNYYIVGRGTLSKADKICIAVPGGATGSGTQLQTATVRSGSSYKYLRWELFPTD